MAKPSPESPLTDVKGASEFLRHHFRTDQRSSSARRDGFTTAHYSIMPLDTSSTDRLSAPDSRNDGECCAAAGGRAGPSASLMGRRVL